MKKLLLILAVLALPVSFQSCGDDDDDTFCWECEIIGGEHPRSETVCDYTEDGINEYEKKMEANAMKNYLSGAISAPLYWICKKK